jgi:hypothetical protein
MGGWDQMAFSPPPELSPDEQQAADRAKMVSGVQHAFGGANPQSIYGKLAQNVGKRGGFPSGGGFRA